MKFTDIAEDLSVFPGEYILHKPSSSIVMAGAFNREENLIRAFKDGKLFEDVELSKKQYKQYKDRKCGKCKGGRI